MTFEDLKNKGYVSVPPEYEQYKKEPLNTPTGRVKLFSTIFEKHGHDPLPVYVEPPQSPANTPELLRDYPLILITGSRCIEHFHSEGRQISPLRKRMPDPEVEMHPETAGKASIQEGDWVWIETPQVTGERVKFKVKLTPHIDSRVVSAANGRRCVDRRQSEAHSARFTSRPSATRQYSVFNWQGHFSSITMKEELNDYPCCGGGKL